MRGELIRRVLAFAVVPAMSILSPLLVTPLIAARFGPAGWSAVAIGMSVGGAASIIVGLSWPTVGAHLVASASEGGERRRLYDDSLTTRLVALSVVGPVAMIVAGELSAAHRFDAAVTALAVTLNGFTCAWYYVGVGTAKPLVANEAGLRFVSTVVTAGLLLLNQGLWVYGWVMLAGWVVSIVRNHLTIAGRALPARPRRNVLREIVTEHGYGTFARMIYGMFYLGSVGLVAVVAPAAVAGYSAFDRVIVIGLNGLFALPQAIAGWVSAGGSGAILGRARRVTAAAGGLAALFLPLAWIGFPIALHLLFAGKAEWTPTQRIVASVLFAAAFLNRGLVLTLLVPLERESAVYGGYVAAAVLGTPLVLLLAHRWGTTGALGAVATVDVLLTSWMLLVGLRRRAAPTAAGRHVGGPGRVVADLLA